MGLMPDRTQTANHDIYAATQVKSSAEVASSRNLYLLDSEPVGGAVFVVPETFVVSAVSGAGTGGNTRAAVQEARHRIQTRLAEMGVSVGPLQERYELPLTAPTTDATVRTFIVKLVSDELGELSLSGDVLITLNGEALDEEIIDRAHAPTIVYAV